VWLEALESATQSVMGVGVVSAMVLKVMATHALDHGVSVDDYYGGARGKGWVTIGGMNGGLVCYIGEL
jgi:hypothetical protein